MEEQKFLAERFEANRPHLQRVAYRMLGSAAEAEDAVQEAWLRLSRSETGDVDNLGGWLTTVTARICLDMLRSRKSRCEEAIDEHSPAPASEETGGFEPEQEALLADSVGLAMLVVLQALTPAERVAFVLHDMFDLSFDEIASVVGRTPEATRQLASRARRRIQGAPAIPEAELSRQRRVVDAFLAASRGGDFEGLLALLDPDVVVRADKAAVALGDTAEMRGATPVAQFFKGRAQLARAALVDGRIGVVVAPKGQLLLVLLPVVANGRIAEIEVVADPVRLAAFELGVLDA
ncbi:MAG: sigma-70 family polymerase sigma factor [Reyranella sp.]|nr:sigma-70 family polymerase sigma factor [Reyranella sp.]